MTRIQEALIHIKLAWTQNRFTAGIFVTAY